MKKTLFSVLASVVFGAFTLNAQEAAPSIAEAAASVVDAAKAAGAEAVEAAKSALTAEAVDAIFAAIPENVVTLGDDVLVSKAEVMDYVKPNIMSAIEAGAPVDASEVNGFIYEVANGMGFRGVMLSNAKKAGITGDLDGAKKKLDEIKQAMAQQAGPDAFAEQLKSMGKTEDEILAMFAEEGMIQAYTEMLDAEVAKTVADPTEEELKACYDANAAELIEPASLSASHILVQFPSQEPSEEEVAAALAKINEIRGKLAADGSNFADLAKEFSDCPSSAQGGELGQFHAGDMVPEFEVALVGLKEGEISGPVKTMFGYHLIKAGASTPERQITFEDCKENIKDFLKKQALDAASRAQLKKLFTESGMKVNLPVPEGAMPFGLEE